MSNNEPWILLDTETSGSTEPLYVIGLAARKMRGWEPEQTGFARLINRQVAVSRQVTRSSGYSRELLERDGEPMTEVHKAFRSYADGLPLVAWNRAFHLEQALLPEWERLGIPGTTDQGFCLQHLAQRLLDPLPTTNCQLLTLAQYYGLPEPSADTRPGVLKTILALLQVVLRPLAQERELADFNQIRQFTQAEWFPTLLPFGKFRGRSFLEARHDPKLRDWLQWLSESNNRRSASMGNWYLRRLETDNATAAQTIPDLSALPTIAMDAAMAGTEDESAAAVTSGAGIVIYRNPELERVRQLVKSARERLAELEAIFAREQNSVAVVQASLFAMLETEYKEKDRLALIVRYRKRFIDSLYTEGEDKAEELRDEYSRAQENMDEEYRQAREDARSKKELTEEEYKEIRNIHRKLCHLYHPDKYQDEPEKQQAYQKLTQEINSAKDRGDINTMREIAEDTPAWLDKVGLQSLDFSEEKTLESLWKVYQDLQIRMMAALEKTNQLRAGPQYELARLCARKPDYLQEVAEDNRASLRKQCEKLQQEAVELAAQIEALTGSPVEDWKL